MLLWSDQLLLDDGRITTESQSSGGGRITIRAGELIDLRRSEVSTTVLSDASATAGDITIDPRFLVLDQSRIIANAQGGQGGNIRIVADNLVLSADSEIDASGEESGTVAVVAQEEDVTDSLVGLDATRLDASSLLRARCAARRDIGASSFTGVGRGGLPPSPDAPLLTGYPIGEAKSADGEEASVEVEQEPTSILALINAPRSQDVIALAMPCKGAQ
jgi:hypothetical protein